MQAHTETSAMKVAQRIDADSERARTRSDLARLGRERGYVLLEPAAMRLRF